MIPGTIPLLAIDVRKICATVNDLHLYAQATLGPVAEPREKKLDVAVRTVKIFVRYPKLILTVQMLLQSEISSVVQYLRLCQSSHLHCFMIDYYANFDG